MAGHSKWANIKHKKAVVDAKRGKLFTKHAKNIQVQSRLCDGDENAPGLRAAIDAAKKDSVPKDNIERAVAKGAGVGGDVMEQINYEAYGPGGTAMVIVSLTDNRNRAAAEVRHLLSQQGIELANPGAAMWAFTTPDGGQTYSPTTTVDLSDEDQGKLDKILEALEESDEVSEVFTTAK
jgi:YebC/PmpR family DNA-binding regulatory protein